MGDVTIEVRPAGEVEPDVLAIPLPADAPDAQLNGAFPLDERLKQRFQRLAADGELKGELGKTLLLHTEEPGARRVVVAGVGKRDAIDADAFRTAAAAVVRRAADVGGTVAWLLDESLPLPLEEQARAIVEGTMLGAYSPGPLEDRRQRRQARREDRALHA